MSEKQIKNQSQNGELGALAGLISKNIVFDLHLNLFQKLLLQVLLPNESLKEERII